LESQSLPRLWASASNDGAAKDIALALASLKNNGVVGIPSNWLGKEGINALNVAGNGAAQFIDALNWLDSQASASLLSGFTDLTAAASSQGRGSNALSSDQSAFFMDLETARAKECSASITDGAIADLVHLNFGPNVPVPEFEIGPLSTEDIEAEITLLGSLASATTNNLPDSFVTDLVMSVGKAWGFDLDKLSKSITAKQKELSAQANTQQQAQMAGTVAAGQVGGSMLNDIATTGGPNTAGNSAANPPTV